MELGSEQPRATAALRPVSVRRRIVSWVARLAVPTAIVLLTIGFGAARPQTFLSYSNFTSILVESAPPAILAAGLTVILAMGDFDLSIGSMLGLGGASAVALMQLHHLAWGWALLIAGLLAVATGLVNGIFVAYLGTSAFITTLAMGTVLLGVEYVFTNQQTLYGVSGAYLRIAQSVPAWQISVQVWIALGVVLALFILLEQTELGRYMYAVGGSREAARLSGLPVRRYLTLGFIIAALAAALAGILVTSYNGSSTPDAGVPYLLPAYAAAFLGSTTFRPGQFNIAGTTLAVLFLGELESGLTMLQFSTSLIDIIQGGILVLAMLLGRLDRRAT